jgi:general secretion pathway protein K
MRTKSLQVLCEEKGFVLITILLVIAVLFPLVLAFNSKVQLSLVRAENFRNSIQAARIVRAGVEGSIGLLKADDASFDSRRERWAQPLPSLPLLDGTLTVKIFDEDSKIPVNLLINANGVDVNRDVETKVRSLVARLGGSPDVVDALIDWIDTNSDVTGSAGAEDDYYYSTKGYHCKNGPLDTLDELLLVKGFDRDLVVNKKLKDFLTVAPTDGKINVNTADIEVLQTVLGTKSPSLPQPLNESDIQDIVRYREGHDFKDLKDLQHVVKMATGQLEKITPLIKVASSYFSVDSSYSLGKVTKSAQAVLKREGAKVTVTWWSEP